MMKATGGWFYESTRHSLAAQGIKTGRRYNAYTSWTGASSRGYTGSLQTTTGGRGAATGTFANVVKSAVTRGGGGGGGGGGGSGGGAATQAAAAAKPPVTPEKTVIVIDKALTSTGRLPTTTTTTAGGGLTSIGKAALEAARTAPDGYSAALGGYVYKGKLYPSNEPTWVPAVAKGVQTQQVTYAGGGESVGGYVGAPASVLTADGKLDVGKAAAYLMKYKTASPEQMAILNKAAVEGKLDTLNTVLRGGATGALAVTGQGASIERLPGGSLVGLKVIPGTTVESRNLAAGLSPVEKEYGKVYVNAAGEEIQWAGPAKELIANPFIPSGLSQAGVANVTSNMAQNPQYTKMAVAATKELANRVKGVVGAGPISTEQASADILTQLGVPYDEKLGFVPQNAAQQNILDQLRGMINAEAQDAGMTQMQYDRWRPTVYDQPLFTSEDVYPVGPGGYLSALKRFRLGMGLREKTLAERYRSYAGIGRDIAGGLSDTARLAAGMAGATGLAVYGASQQPAAEQVVYAARKGMGPWLRR